MRVLLAITWLLVASVAFADDPGKNEKCSPIYTISSQGNFAPDATGFDLRGYSQNLTLQLVLTSGTLSLNMEGALEGMPFTWALGTFTASYAGGLPAGGGPDRVRLNPVTCTACVASAKFCGYK